MKFQEEEEEEKEVVGITSCRKRNIGCLFRAGQGWPEVMDR